MPPGRPQRGQHALQERARDCAHTERSTVASAHKSLRPWAPPLSSATLFCVPRRNGSSKRRARPARRSIRRRPSRSPLAQIDLLALENVDVVRQFPDYDADEQRHGVAPGRPLVRRPPASDLPSNSRHFLSFDSPPSRPGRRCRHLDADTVAS